MSVLPGPRRWLRAAGRLARKVPLALALTTLLWAAAIATGSMLSGPPPAIEHEVPVSLQSLAQGRWWTVFSSAFFSGNLASHLLASAVLLGFVGLAEATMGTRRTAVAFMAGHLGALVLYFSVVPLGVALGSEWLAGMLHAPLAGPYAASLAAVIAASPLISALWRRRLRSLILAVTLMLLLYIGHPQNLLAFLGVLCGFGLAAVMSPRPAEAHFMRSTSRETRALLSMIVAVFAAGPVMAGLAQAPSGPLAILRNLIVNPVPTINQLQANCPAAVDLSCAQVIHSPGLDGPGGVALSLVPLVLLLVCAEGLRRGNRIALWAAISAHLVIGVLSAVYLQLFSLFGLYTRSGGRVLPVGPGVVEVLPVVLVPFVIAGLLYANRRHFIVDTDPVLRRRTLILLPSVFAVFAGGYVAAWFAEDNYYRRAGLLALLTTLPRMFLPYPFSFRYSVSVYPHGFFSPLLFSYGGAAFWLVCLVSALLLFLSRRIRSHRPESDLARAGELVRRGGNSLSWMALWPNNRYWFNAAGTVGIAYQMHYNVALTVGGPFGNPEDFEAASQEFILFCTAQSLTPCWYSVTDANWDALRSLGFRRVSVAEETMLPIRGIEFKGKEWQNVRTALNKAQKLGITARWDVYSALSVGLRTQINEISEDWVSEKALPEMGFTLGSVEELKDDNVLLCLAVDEEGKVHGVTSWLPVFRDQEVVSWTLDFMRRNSQGFNGVMEFLIASAVLRFKETVDTISLSGSPLTRSEKGPSAPGPGEDPLAAADGTLVERFLKLLGNALEPVYGFQSLAAFKQRFQPQHRALYMMYQDPLRLPSIGRAVTEAYMPNLSVRQTARLLRGIMG
ncbi:phosphatidylglycerol lysyltransferase domain-containing protein [Arthrobacter oryzae]|uniref:Lysylphosphatidylglycerol synthetase-like protein (DUF2156 family) n=1 Tax=Arthrobacter oryzae TaxID=409290 RepID=A0A495FMP9_9MICC|nr:phosphatidylglycerol lysyltransferase domain-containing protein [Arthrobacter oryzae]RKR30508.1 lysylphosphatidylglycerol synthetase-like protein (DUF2156 family) [Arthrobacter oryzae]